MISFLATYDYVFYRLWLILFVIRGFFNHSIFSARGDAEMDTYKSYWEPDHLANLMVYFTFWLDEDETDSERLKRKVLYVNRLHIAFAIYSVLLFIMFLMTYGK